MVRNDDGMMGHVPRLTGLEAGVVELMRLGGRRAEECATHAEPMKEEKKVDR